jgi:ABC-2 type transport system ATP-binding protein
MIEVKNLTLYYGDTSAVQDVSFSIQDREIVGFLGLNGAGKTTILKMLAGLLYPSAGTICMNGVDAVTDADSLRARIGFLPEDPPLYEDMRVGDFLRWCGAVRGMSAANLEARLPGVLAKCQLDGVAHRVIEELSHGFRKRVGIAQAILHKPELVILDEPISGLDPVQIVEMRSVIRNLKSECTVLISSHILSEVHQTCDRILVLNEGKLVAEGTEDELARRATGGSARISVVVRGAAATLATTLAGLSAVTGHTVDSESNGLVHASIDLGDDCREAVVAALVGAGMGIRRIEDTEGELEHIFLDITKSKEAS